MKSEVRFVIASQSDAGFKSALKELADDFSDCKVVGVRREETVQDGKTVAECVIEVDCPDV